MKPARSSVAGFVEPPPKINDVPVGNAFAIPNLVVPLFPLSVVVPPYVLTALRAKVPEPP